MSSDLASKTARYEKMLTRALDESTIVIPEGTINFEAATEHWEMAQSYLEDGRHFRANDDNVNALAAFSYGHAWLDSGARLGFFDVPTEGDLFTV